MNSPAQLAILESLEQVRQHIAKGEVARRLRVAIDECDRYIAKESPRSEELRPQKTKDLLAFYIEHRANLRTALEQLTA